MIPSQVVPWYFSSQVHVKVDSPLSEFVHVPPFWHGSESQGFCPVGGAEEKLLTRHKSYTRVMSGHKNMWEGNRSTVQFKQLMSSIRQGCYWP